MDEQTPYEPQPVEAYTPLPTEAPPPPNYYAQPPVGQPVQGLTDTNAGTIAYLTIIPAIIFLAIEPYNRRVFVRFHAMQCLLLGATSVALQFLHIIPILGSIAALLISLAIVVFWFIAIFNAAQGKMYEVPLIGKYALQYANSTA